MKHCNLPPREVSKMEASLSPLGDMVRNFPVSKLHVLVSYRPRTNDHVVRTSLILSGETLVSSDHHAQAHAAFDAVLITSCASCSVIRTGWTT